MAKINKDLHDKFYTKKEIARFLITQLNLNDYDLIIEPSAGSGSFSNILTDLKSKYSYDTEFYDILPEGKNIIKMDYLEYNVKSQYKNILVIGNPPFGNNSKLAISFINHSANINANTIGFILSKSFKKASMLNKINPYYHIIKIIDLDDNSFTLNNEEYKVPTSFFLFERKEQKRDKYIPKTKSQHIKFVKYGELCDYTMRRVGVNAGKIYNDIDKSKESHYFIKSSDEIKEFLMSKKWEFNNSAGVNSISKTEIIEEIDEYLKNFPQKKIN